MVIPKNIKILGRWSRRWMNTFSRLDEHNIKAFKAGKEV